MPDVLIDRITKPGDAPQHSVAAPPGWAREWEDNVYAQGRRLNRYPHHTVVGFVLRTFRETRDRSAARILELGCGAGNNLWFAAREGFFVAGIDGSATAIDYARRRFAREGLSGDLRVGDFARLPWDNASFDMVLDRGSLTHARRATISAALDEAARVLRPGGRLLSVNLFSPQHPGRRFGRDLGDNSCDAFSGGYFEGLGVVHFATREEILELYGSRFAVTALVHTCETDAVTGDVCDAFWRVECEKLP